MSDQTSIAKIDSLTDKLANAVEALRNIRNAALPDPYDERDISLEWLRKIINKNTALEATITEKLNRADTVNSNLLNDCEDKDKECINLTDKLAKAEKALERIGCEPQASVRHAKIIALRALADLQEIKE